MTPRASDAAMSSSTAVSSRITSRARALRFSGRSSVTVVMSPSRFTLIWCTVTSFDNSDVGEVHQ